MPDSVIKSAGHVADYDSFTAAHGARNESRLGMPGFEVWPPTAARRHFSSLDIRRSASGLPPV